MASIVTKPGARSNQQLPGSSHSGDGKSVATDLRLPAISPAGIGEQRQADALVEGKQAKAPSAGRVRTSQEGMKRPANVNAASPLGQAARQYDRMRYGLPEVPDDVTVEDLLRHVAESGVSAPPTLHGATSDAEKIAVLNAIATIAQNQVDPHGQESDLLLTIDGKQRPLTVIFSADGKVTATLGKEQPFAPVRTFRNRSSAVQALERQFGVRAVEGFTVAELTKVFDAFSRFSPKEQRALRGITLERTATLPNQLAGLYDTGAHTIYLADLAFASDGSNFVGNRSNPTPPSIQIIAHEVAHAIAAAPVRRAFNSSVAAYNRPANDQAYQRGVNDNLRGMTDSPETRSYVEAVYEVHNALAALAMEEDESKVPQLRQALARATTQRDRAAAALDGENAHKAQRASSAQNARVSQLYKVIDARTRARGDPPRVEAFVAFVNGQQPPLVPLTEYARKNWPAEPGEFFAESLSLFHTDPDYLRSNYPALFTFFQQDRHLVD